MFKIEGLFLNDFSKTHLSAVKSLADYLNEVLGKELTPRSLFFLQEQIYGIHQIGANALSNSVMQERTFDCKAGCNHCCHATDVDITPLEAFYLAGFVKSQSNETPDQIIPRQNEKSPCPLLKDGLCTAYDARPLSCRYIMSTDVAACIKRHETLIGGAKLPSPFSNFRTSISAACFIVYKSKGLDARWLVLDKTIGQIIDDETIMEKWLAGNKLNNPMKADEPEGRFAELIEAASK